MVVKSLSVWFSLVFLLSLSQPGVSVPFGTLTYSTFCFLFFQGKMWVNKTVVYVKFVTETRSVTWSTISISSLGFWTGVPWMNVRSLPPFRHGSICLLTSFSSPFTFYVDHSLIPMFLSTLSAPVSSGGLFHYDSSLDFLYSFIWDIYRPLLVRFVFLVGSVSGTTSSRRTNSSRLVRVPYLIPPILSFRRLAYISRNILSEP